MRKFLFYALLTCCFAGGGRLSADEVTFSFVNLSNATFSASAAGLEFGQAVNVLATDDNNGKSVTLTALDSGFTGAATSFVAGPPLKADYSGAGAGSVLVQASGHVFLAGEMDDLGRLEAEYPNRAGAFGSRFAVTFVDPAVLAALGTGGSFAPEGGVALTLAETSFDGTTLHATLGGGEFTIETAAPVPEVATLFLYGTGLALMTLGARRYWQG